ncbi:MAG: hypothetical protein NT130_04400 [Candidatus Micrarchaeota archaeon]|nr:hypothetical protein [Candidatus Micrarchaeota archaeon]
MDRRLLLAGLLVFIILSFGCIGTKQFPLKGLGLAKCEVNKSYVENVPYQTVEYYTEKVPYTYIQYASEKEPYNIQEPYTEKQCVDVPYIARECSEESIAYSVTDRKCYITGWLQNWINIECKVNNLDSQGGSFIIYTGFASADRPSFSGDWNIAKQTGENRTVYIYPGSSRTFDYTYELPASNPHYVCFCDAIPLSTKEVCRDVEATKQVCRDVTKYKTLTEYKTVTDLTKNWTVAGYRNETRSASVTKYRTETAYWVVEENC